MNRIRLIVICICVGFALAGVQGAVAAATSWGTPDGRFRDDSAALGIDHSRPNAHLAVNLEKKLYTLRAQQLNISPEQQARDLEQFSLPPGNTPAVGSKGTRKILVFLVDFPDYPHGNAQTAADADSKLNGPGDPDLYPTDNLHDFYSRASYNQLDLQSSVYGWYRAKNNRNYYNNNSWALFAEVMNAYNSSVNYADFDNDGDGDIDNIFLYWTGPDTHWGTFWWAYHSSFNYAGTPRTWDGVYISSFCWEWYTRPWTTSGLFDPNTPSHEMGHALGLPDYYDYNGTVGPNGGVGGFDMMDGNWLDHNTFSKYLLGWKTPIVIGSDPHDTSGALYPAGDQGPQTSVLIFPGTSLDSYGEFFIMENRAPGHGNDPDTWPYYNTTTKAWESRSWTRKGLSIWHVDSTLDPVTHNFKYDNSVTSHKLLRLMEADGKEDIEAGGNWNPADIYGTDQFFGPTTVPDSTGYDGYTGVHAQDISTGLGDVAWARYLIGEYPPTITSITPGTGTPNTLLSISDLEGSNFWVHPKTAVYFMYWKKMGAISQLRWNYATNVTVVSRTQIRCDFNLAGVPAKTYAITVENPDGESATLANALTVQPPTLRVNVPNGGQVWWPGTPHMISWSQTGLSGTNVRIDLWQSWPDGVHRRVIAPSVPAANGSYMWNIPADITPGTDYWVNISSLSYPAVSDYTDGWLEIAAPPATLQVTVPNGGQVWWTGTPHMISWSQTWLSGTNVRIDLWQSWPDGVHRRVIAPSVPAANGSYMWNIPADITPGTDYWVNISSLSYPAVYDYTDGWLEIAAPPPVVTGITPASGTQGTLVTITNLSGTGFREGAKVFFNRSGSTPLSATNVSVASAKKITCTVKIPAGAITGRWDVMVKNTDGKSGKMDGIFIVNTPPAPTVTGITPASGKQGTLVAVTNLSGTGFRDGAKVFFNRSGSTPLPATNVSVASAQKITCTVKIPAGAIIGLWDVTVKNTDGKSAKKNGIFLVKTPSAPTVTGIIPASGKRGTLVTITNISGTGFVSSPKPAVQFLNGAAILNATNVTVSSAKRINCTVRIPADAATGVWDVKVTNADRQAGKKSGAFTVKI